MKTLKLFLLSVLESLEFGWQAIRYALILVLSVVWLSHDSPLYLPFLTKAYA